MILKDVYDNCNNEDVIVIEGIKVYCEKIKSKEIMMCADIYSTQYVECASKIAIGTHDYCKKFFEPNECYTLFKWNEKKELFEIQCTYNYKNRLSTLEQYFRELLKHGEVYIYEDNDEYFICKNNDGCYYEVTVKFRESYFEPDCYVERYYEFKTLSEVKNFITTVY